MLLKLVGNAKKKYLEKSKSLPFRVEPRYRYCLKDGGIWVTQKLNYVELNRFLLLTSDTFDN